MEVTVVENLDAINSKIVDVTKICNERNETTLARPNKNIKTFIVFHNIVDFF